MSDLDAQVGIVGAGPIGLSCALRLAQFGVSSIVLEAEPALRRQGSKACLIQGDVLEILDKVGCGEQIAAEGVSWHIARTYARGREIARTVYDIPIGFGPFVNISQFRIEQVLLDALADSRHARVLWSHGVTAVEQDTEAVTVGAGGSALRFRYLVGCDGVHSTMRELLGVTWTGRTYDDRFLITDIQAELPVARERHFHYDPPFNPGRQLVMHAQPDNVWRIDWQLPPTADIEEERRTGALDRRIRDVIGEMPYRIEWLSTYRFHQRVVERFRVGDVFLAGDAAHALPPYGARGMNSGIQDADNLAWKLASVLAGQADDALLDTYHTERYAATRENLRVTQATIEFMVPRSWLRGLARSVLLRLSTLARPLARWVNSGTMAEPFVYSDSPIVVGDDGLVGRFAPDRPVLTDGRPARLRRLLGHGFVLLYFAADGTDGRTAIRRLPLVEPAAEVVVVLPGSEHDHLPTDRGRVVLDQNRRSTAGGYRKRHWYVVRPDGHIAASCPVDQVDRLANLLARCRGSAATPVSGLA